MSVSLRKGGSGTALVFSRKRRCGARRGARNTRVTRFSELHKKFMPSVTAALGKRQRQLALLRVRKLVRGGAIKNVDQDDDE